MRTWVAMTVAAALTGCAPSITGSAPTPSSVQSASFSMKSWGRPLHHWSMDEAGRVEHFQNPSPFGHDGAAVLLVRRTVLSPQRREAVSLAIERVKTILAEPEGCAMRMTDGPYGELEWTEGGQVAKLPWNANCTQGRDAELARAVSAVDKIVDDAAMAGDPVERRPIDPTGR